MPLFSSLPNMVYVLPLPVWPYAKMHTCRCSTQQETPAEGVQHSIQVHAESSSKEICSLPYHAMASSALPCIYTSTSGVLVPAGMCSCLSNAKYNTSWPSAHLVVIQCGLKELADRLKHGSLVSKPIDCSIKQCSRVQLPAFKTLNHAPCVRPGLTG